MAFHPRERRMPRRQFIRLTAYGAAAAGLAPSLLAACGGDDERRCRGERRQAVAARRRRSTLPTFDDIPAIEDGLQPETGTLKVYNYEEYISPDVLAAFEEEFGVTVEVTTFTSMDEAVTRLASGEVAFDVFFPTPDRVGQLAAGQAAAAAQQVVPAEPRQRLGVAAGPVLRPGQRLHRAVHALHDRHRLPHRRRGQGAGRVRRPVRHLLGPGQPGPGVPLEDDREVFGHGAAAPRPGGRRQHRGPRADRRRARRRHRS